MSHSYIQIPPDSTGKKIRHTPMLDMEVTNVLVILDSLLKNEEVLGGTSGATGLYMGYHTEYNETYIFIHPLTGTFVEDELISVGGVDVATSEASVIQYTSNTILSDPDNPLHRQKVGHGGAAHIRFEEGNQLFDSWGRTQTSTVSIMGSFNFIYQDPGVASFYDRVVDGGVVNAVTESSYLSITTDTTSGSIASRSTHQYYPYLPGEGNEWRAYMQLSDVGKAGVTKRYGLFDEFNGMFFEQEGTIQYVTIRSNVTGTVVDTKIRRTDMNGEHLDGEGAPFVLDITKFNLWWIDYAGVAKVRFGVFKPDGERVVLHTWEDLNNQVLPQLKIATLPIHFELENTGTVASPSEIKVASTSISRQSPANEYFGKKYFHQSPRTEVSGSATYTPSFSVKPKLTQGGFPNRITFQPTDLEWIVEGDPCVVTVLANSGLTGASYSDHWNPASAAQIDNSATAIAGGTPFEKIFIKDTGIRTMAIDLSLAFQLHGSGMLQPTLSFGVQTVDPNGTANVTLMIRWREIH
jgi:hypothetical protein